MPFSFSFYLTDEVEIRAVLHRVQQRSSLCALIGQNHGRRQVPRIGINRVTEQRELNKRNAEHHGEGETVAAHLHEFLRDDSAQALKRKFWMPFHNLVYSIKLMKASSKPDGIFRQSYGS